MRGMVMKMNNKIAKLLCLTVFAVFLVGLATISVEANEGIRVILIGDELTFDASPQIIDNRTMVPVQAIFEALGAQVVMNEFFQRFNAYPGDGSIIRMGVGSNEILIRTRFAETISIPIDVAPQIIDNQMLVPIRAVAENLGAYVEWVQDTQTVVITTDTTITYKTITVSTAEEFVSAISSNRTIIVNPGTYDFFPWTDRPISPSGGLRSFQISGVRNLSIIGSLDGDVKFVGAGLFLSHSENINIENIILLQQTGSFHMSASNNVVINNVTSAGFSIRDRSDNIILDGIEVTGDNSTIAIFGGSNVTIRNSNISNNINVTGILFDIHASDVRIENSIISRNTYNPNCELVMRNPWFVALFVITNNSNVVISNTTIEGNVFRYAISTNPAGNNIEYEDGIFDNNLFDVLIFSELGEGVG